MRFRALQMSEASLAYQNDEGREALRYETLAGGSVLVVDDEPGMRNFLRRSRGRRWQPSPFRARVKRASRFP